MSGWDFDSPSPAASGEVADLAVVVASLESQLVDLRGQLAQLRSDCERLVAVARAEAVAGRQADHRMVFGLFDQLLGMLRSGELVVAGDESVVRPDPVSVTPSVPVPVSVPVGGWEQFRTGDPLRLVDNVEMWAPPARLAS